MNQTELEQYDQYVTMSNSPRMGGVTLFFKKQWKINRIKENVRYPKYWINAYMAKCENMSFIIVIIYRSPSYSKRKFCEDLQQFLEDLCVNDIIIAGDFNIDWQLDFYKSKLESILNDNDIE